MTSPEATVTLASGWSDDLTAMTSFLGVGFRSLQAEVEFQV
jgi:hypothetical protein